MSTQARDLKNNLLSAASLNPAARTATANGAAADMITGDGLCSITVFNGTITDGTHTITVQESDDSAFTSPSAVTLLDSLTALTSGVAAGTIQRAKFQRSKRYVRAVTTVAGATTGGVYGAFFDQQLKQF